MTAFSLSPLSLTVVERYGCAVLTLTGDLDAATAPDLYAAVDTLIAGRSRIIIDAGKLRFTTAQGTDALMEVAKTARAAGVSLVFADVQPLVWTALRFVVAADDIPVYDTVEGAAMNDVDQLNIEFL